MKLLYRPETILVPSKDKWKYHVKSNGAPFCILKHHSIVIEDGKIKALLNNQDVVLDKYEVVDCKGKSIIPGFVDCHTHSVWTGDRCHEFEMKLNGATYMDIHQMGGGIGFTVGKVRQASEDELEKLFEERIRLMIRNGTTLLECKSGYGLDTETEMKMLRVIETVRKKMINEVDIVSTYLGAHSYPKDKSREEYEKEILCEHIPRIAELKEKGEINPELIDVFLEKGVFDVEMSKKILLAGKEIGLGINFHGDELNYMHAGELAGEIGALGVSHCEQISKDGISSMAKSGVVAVLLPTTAYVLRIEYPPARALIDNDVPVAIATDFNPNAHCLSMPFVMNLSCIQMKITMEEALMGATLNAAASLGKSDEYGSIEVGKSADFVVVNHKDWRHVIYELIDPPISMVIKKGKIVFVGCEFCP